MTRNQIITKIRQDVTDALNRQNTAAKVRGVLEAITNNLFSAQDDTIPVTSVTGLQLTLNAKADYAPLAVDQYGAGKPTRALATLNDFVAYTFGGTYTPPPTAGSPTISNPQFTGDPTISNPQFSAA